MKVLFRVKGLGLGFIKGYDPQLNGNETETGILGWFIRLGCVDSGFSFGGVPSFGKLPILNPRSHGCPGCDGGTDQRKLMIVRTHSLAAGLNEHCALVDNILHHYNPCNPQDIGLKV